jgi:hypothetical protein
MARLRVNDDLTFAGWHGYYRNEQNERVTLGLRLRVGGIVLITHTGERLNFTPLETGLLLDGLAAALRAVGSVS